MTRTTGVATSSYTYDSFGNTVATSGSLVNSFQYTGREFDVETSLYYYRARYYDAQTGRFLGEDPIAFGGGANFYVYVQNSPIWHIDPFGQRARPAPPGLILGLQNIFPGSTFDGATLTVPMPCGDVLSKLSAQGYQEANSWGWSGPFSPFWNPINHAGGWEVRTFGPGFHFRVKYPPPPLYGKYPLPHCDKPGECKLDQFHVDDSNPLEPGQTWRHLKCDFFRACGS